MEQLQDRQLNEKESIELISRMIRNTQQKMEEGSGTMFLIWGYPSIIVTFLVWALVVYTKNYQWQWLWFLLPTTSTILTTIYYKKRRNTTFVTTYIDKIISYIWLVLGVTAFLLSMVSIVHYLPILFIVVLIMGIGTTLTGLIIKFRPLIISGVLGMLLSVVLSLLSWKMQLPLFAAIFLFMMIIPGHYLNYKAKGNHV